MAPFLRGGAVLSIISLKAHFSQISLRLASKLFLKEKISHNSLTLKKQFHYTLLMMMPFQKEHVFTGKVLIGPIFHHYKEKKNKLLQFSSFLLLFSLLTIPSA